MTATIRDIKHLIDNEWCSLVPVRKSDSRRPSDPDLIPISPLKLKGIELPDALWDLEGLQAEISGLQQLLAIVQNVALR